MLIYAPYSQDGQNITVTGTSGELFDLVNTAQGTNIPYAGYKSFHDAVIITVEGGSIRMGYGVEPTAELGTVLNRGGSYGFVGTSITNIRLISVDGSDSKVSIQVGDSAAGESNWVSFNGPFDTGALPSDGKTLTMEAPTADTEYAFQIPEGTSKLTFKLRDRNVDFKYALGSAADAGILSTANYSQMNGGDIYCEDGLDVSDDQYMYFSSTDASQVGELIYWVVN